MSEAQGREPKTTKLKMYLVDGIHDGTVIAKIFNWNGRAIKIPRSKLSSFCAADMEKPGIYMLFCPKENEKDSVYIGESENVLRRLKGHRLESDKSTGDDYWNTAVVFLGDDLHKSYIRYLEARLIQEAKECDRDKVLNKNETAGALDKLDEDPMEDFINNIKLLMHALGYKTLIPLPQPDEKTRIFFCTGNGADAKGFLSPGGFTVEKDSRISDHVAKGFGDYEKSNSGLRDRLVQDGVIKDDVFVRSYEFSSPSAAAAVVQGNAPCGYRDWKAEDGKTLKEFMESQAG